MSGELVEASQLRVNPENPLIKKVDQISRRKEVFFKEPSPQTKKQLENLGERIPDKDPFALRAVIFKPENLKTNVHEEEKKLLEKIGIFYIPGAEGTAAGSAPIAASLLDHQISDARIGLSASISQFASADTVKGALNYVGDPNKRASNLAAFITEIIKNTSNPPQKLYLIATSMAGVDLLRATPIIDQLLEQNGVDSKVGGVIFNQAGGLYNQDFKEFILKRVGKHTSCFDEVKMLYPSFEDFADVQTEVELAMEKGDKPLELHKRRQLEQMKQYKQDPPYLELLSENERQRLAALEQAIDFSSDKKTANIQQVDGSAKQASVSQLQQERKSILVGLIKKIFSANEIDPKAMHPASYAKILPTSTTSLVKVAEIKKRQAITCPAAIVMAEEEAYFKYKELMSGKVGLKIEQGQELFPEAEKTYFAKVQGWAHNASLIDPVRFSSIMIDIITRMRRDSKNESRQQATREITLTY